MPKPRTKRCDCHLCGGLYVDANTASLHKSWAIAASKKAERERAQMQELEDQVAHLALTNSTCTLSNRMWGRDNGDVIRGIGTTFAADESGDVVIPADSGEGARIGVSTVPVHNALLTELASLDVEMEKRIKTLDGLITAPNQHVDAKLRGEIEEEATWLAETSRRLGEVKAGGNAAVGMMVQAMSDTIANRRKQLDSWRASHGPASSREDIVNTGNYTPCAVWT